MKTRQIIVYGLLAVVLAFTLTVCNDGGNSDYWKITWNLNGGTFASGSNHPTQVEKGAVLAKPSPDPTKDGNTFGGWYANSGLTQEYNFAGPVTADLILYAKWDQLPAEITVTAGSSLAEKLQWVKDNAQSNTIYFIEVDADESIATQVLSYNKRGITIHLEGIDGEKVVSLSSKGSLFIVDSATVTLIIDKNITLQGLSDQLDSLVTVNHGTFEMRTGAKISNNSISSSNSNLNDGGSGGGVGVDYYGTFIMNGGEISNNSAINHGGGVYVFNAGTFIMNDGKISGNSGDDGGGVYIYGTFTMNGGVISDNTASSNVGSYGGGVYVRSTGTFTMNGGGISGNTVTSNPGPGGGVYVVGGGTFRIVTGTVYGSNAEEGLKNTATSGAALSGTAQYGTFTEETWTSAGDLSTTNDTIKVVNGVLQQ